MKIIWLQAFASVVKYNSFSIAAEEMFTSQSNVSKYVHALEDELNLTLFDRSTRTLSITPAGRMVLQHAEAMLREYSTLCSDIQTYRSGSSSSIKIVSVPIMHLYDLSGVLVAFKKYNTDIQVEMIETDMLGVISQLKSSNNTIGILRECSLRLLPENVKWQTSSFISDELILLCGKGHPFASAESISISDCLNSNLLVLSTGFEEYKLILEDYGILPSRFLPSIKCASVTTLENYVANNLGVSIITKGMAKHLRNNKNIIFRHFVERPQFPLVIVAAEHTMSEKASMLIHQMVEKSSQHMLNEDNVR